MIPSQSPLQAMEYNNHPQGARHQSADEYGTSPSASAALSYSTTPSRQPHRSRDHHDTPPRHDTSSHELPESPVQFGHSDRHELHMGDRHLPPLDLSQPPPPPPAHRSRHSSVGPDSPQVSPTKAGSSMPMRRDVLKSEAHRHTGSTSSARLSYSHHDSPSSPHSPAGYGTPSPRHQSYDSGYGGRSLHATVEDAPDSPTGPAYSSRHGSEPPYERGPSPLPYSRGSGQPSPSYQSPRYHPSQYDEQEYDHGYRRSPSPAPPAPQRGYGGSSHSTPQHRQGRHGREYDDVPPRTPNYGVPAPPSSLQYNMDPRLARDVGERINDERQYDARLTGQHTSPARGRQWSEPPPSYGTPPHGHSRHGSAITYSGAPQDTPPPPRGHGRNMSASPAHSIPRKSVSPAPPPADDRRRLSDVPFGPDSYDAFNPSMVSSRSSNSALSGQERKDPNAKIVMYDGSEVDPSDHLPMESWAPEPEPKPGQKAPSMDHSRRSPGGAQPMPPSGRRHVRLSRAETAPAGFEEPHTPPAPVSTGRNRLQKKAPQGASVSPGASSPLAPIHPENYQERHGYGSHGRSGHTYRSSYDYPSENHYGNGPPIPAKVPLMSGANGSADSSLMEEMQRIDIGNGRSRRRGGY